MSPGPEHFREPFTPPTKPGASEAERIVADAISDNHCTSVGCNCHEVHARDAIRALRQAGLLPAGS